MPIFFFAGIHSARIGLYCGVMFVEFNAAYWRDLQLKPSIFQYSIFLRDVVND